MKKSIIITIALLFGVTMATHADPRGWGVGLGTFDGDFGVQARKDFTFGSELQYEAVLQGGIYNQNKWTGRLDADFHYIINPASGFKFYPLVGFDWAIQSKNNRAGANLGVGGMLDLNAETRLFLEAKYVAGDWDGFAFTAGIYF